MPDYAALLDAHIAAQRGCYVSGVDVLPDGGRFLWSAHLPEPSLNIAVDTEDADAIRAAAAARRRMPAVLVPDDAGVQRLAERPGIAAAFPIAWMVRSDLDGAAPEHDGLSLEVTHGHRPSPNFFTVARGLYDDPQVNAAAEAYVAVLEGADGGADVAPLHLVLRDGSGQPVAGASLYRVGPLAGLYNVGTIAARQRRGLGRAVTRAALALAAEAGAEAVFLQCAAHGTVERLYAGLGFAVAARPALVCLHPDGA